MEVFKTLAAYGGLALGLINLGLLIYKYYFRRGKLTAVIRRAEVRSVNYGDFDVQLELGVNAKGGAIFLREMELGCLGCEVFDPSKGVSTQKIFRVVDSSGYSFFDLPVDVFKTKVEKLMVKSSLVSNLKIEEKEHRSISVLARICVERGMDGFGDWPRSGWYLRIVHSEGEEVVDFSFEVHSSNKVNIFSGV